MATPVRIITTKKAINIRIDADLHDRMKHYCIDHGTTITEVVTNIFENLVPAESGEDGSEIDDRADDDLDG
jgi:hypothetical protein